METYLNETLHLASPADLPDGRPLFYLDISTELISLQQVETVLRRQEIGKAANIDSIQPEPLKYGAGVLAEL